MKRIRVVAAFLIGVLLVILPIRLPSILPLFAQPGNAQTVTNQPDRGLEAAFTSTIQGSERLAGLFTLYRQKQTGKLFLEVRPDQLERNYLATMTLESGVGERGIYSGLPIGDFLFTFRRVNNSLQFTVPNLYFRARPGEPAQRSVERSFSDSVLAALPIRAVNAKSKSLLVDLGPLLLTSDLPDLSPVLSAALGSAYNLDSGKSYFGPSKAFPLNVEIESVYTFSGGMEKNSNLPIYLSALPDSRALSLRVHYSFSALPEKDGYKPRLADDRVGYFITAYQDFSDTGFRRPFVRYINRWRLEKKDPTAPLSPPKKPIVFWIENTVPVEYRAGVREGVLMWNQAFEKLGFKNAIQVRQMPDNAPWDPADVRYNTIRWFNSIDAAFAMGPSRVNPLTGEILDADIIVDANFIRALKQEYRDVIEQNQMRTMPFLAQLTGTPNLCNYGLTARYLRQQTRPEQPQAAKLRFSSRLANQQDLCFGLDGIRQFSVGSMSLQLVQNALPNGSEMKEYIRQFLRSLIAHEVGHTLGLRHNFRASAMLSPEELNNPAILEQKGMVGSVMDYSGVNLAPQGQKQGAYFTSRVGPYDEWAIEYGYKPSEAIVPQAESRLLEEIARRAPQPELAYATDEDAFAQLDPTINLFDLSGDQITYARWQMANAQEMWQRIDRRYPGRGESFSDARIAFNSVFDYYFQQALFLTTYVGGQSFNRFRGGDAQGRLPFEPIPLEKQRQALAVLQEQVFADTAFRFPATFINKLAPSRWSHWGASPSFFSLDYPIHDRILFLQSAILDELLAPDRLARLRDGDLKAEGKQILTIPELFTSLQTAIWKEVVQSDGKPVQLSSLRRALQREHVNRLIAMVLRQKPVPEDARAIAWYQLRQLKDALGKANGRIQKDDLYTKAHLEEARDRIGKALAANLESR